MADLSVADAMALTRDGDMFGGSTGAWWIIILFLFMFSSGNFGGFGNGYQNALTRADLSQGFNDQNLLNQVINNGNRVIDGINQVDNSVTNVGYNLQTIGCSLGKTIGDAKSEILTSGAISTRDIIESNTNNTQRILDKINEYEINTLKDKLQDYAIQLSNINQTASILSQVRPFPVPAYITCSPYQSSTTGTCGCGYNTL